MATTINVKCRLCASWVKLATIDYHVARQCPDAFKRCSSCCKVIKRKHFNRHKEEECSISLEQKQEKEKLAEETKFLMITCIYCHQLVNKSEIGDHAKKFCPERMTTCSQCRVQLRKKVLAKHLERCPASCINSAIPMENRSEGENRFRTGDILQIELHSSISK